MNANLLFLLNALSTWYMVGLIWMVQLVHYKMFDRVGEDVFARYATDHARLITPVVAIPMLIEIATAVGLLFSRPGNLSMTWAAVGLGLVVLIWASTAALQVPAHGKLASGFQADVYTTLVTTNWIRTVGWSIRGFLVGWAFWTLLPSSG
ncbi:putative transmembrane region and signal peptide protein [Rhodopirellula islandica]|uniref:Transmembrane region and signal peptide protein n=1 Tax=Rhodopirellula islandica TaxID=595434 RepID=A0A0J1B3Z2_RHOIS|nr:hypothetical protein [Rhodopirellula islandica]KLU01201.1 putative transmembrane region and signal peptide protein [Rhodopirellula islandica]